MRPQLHIIEPGLNGPSGHCQSLVTALVEAAGDCDVTVWGGEHAEAAWPSPARLVRHFKRRSRRWQMVGLLRRLLRGTDRVLIVTAGTPEFVAAALTLRRRLPAGQLNLFVHWLGHKVDKAGLLSRLARWQPGLAVLAPTEAVASFFARCGFATTQVPYPVQAPTGLAGDGTKPQARTPARFRHLLVAGGARLDKGFDHIVDLVAEMQARGSPWPITVQVSTEVQHSNQPELAAHIARLHQLQHPGLTLVSQAMAAADYAALFDGAVVLQPYRRQDFIDRVSGVTLDALAAGAPVVVTAGTWMARLVAQHDAGICCDEPSGHSLHQAVEQVLADYPHFAAHALTASAALRAGHSARALIDQVLRGGAIAR